MATPLTDPLILASIVAGSIGGIALVQARAQSRLLHRRISTGAGTIVFDDSTGLYSGAAAWQCIRAEASRASRLGRPLHVWLGTIDQGASLDEVGRALAFDLPESAMGIRLDDSHVCVVSCADGAAIGSGTGDGLTWLDRTIPPGDEAAASALAFITEANGG